MHIHWRKPVGPVRPPFALTRNGAWGRRTYACRCGRQWVREERQPPPPRWQEVTR